MSVIKRFIPFYELYNLLHPQMLNYQKKNYQRFNLNRKLWQRISYDQLKHIKEPRPWLDQGDSRILLKKNSLFATLKASWQESLLAWSDEGYAILDAFYNSNVCDEIIQSTDDLINKGKTKERDRNKYWNAVKQSQYLLSLFSEPGGIVDVLELLLGAKLELFQSLSFYKGSQQDPHSDQIHMTTAPLGYLIAIWVALEDIHKDSGPLIYYPGSHKLEYISNAHFGNDKGQILESNRHRKYEACIKKAIDQYTLKPKTLLAKKGDVLIWHSNLIHAGSPILNEEASRKSLVIHYFCPDVICYHEISRRPALMKL